MGFEICSMQFVEIGKRVKMNICSVRSALIQQRNDVESGLKKQFENHFFEGQKPGPQTHHRQDEAEPGRKSSAGNVENGPSKVWVCPGRNGVCSGPKLRPIQVAPDV